MAAPQLSAVRRTGQLLTGLGSLLVLCAVLAGGPIALLAFAGNPLPDHLPTLAEIGTTLTSRDDGQLFLRALAVLGWFGWATFAFSVLVELGAQSLHRPAPRLPGMRRQQRAAAALVGSVALILAATPVAASAATAAAPPPAAAATAFRAAPPAATAPTVAPAVSRATPAGTATGMQVPEPAALSVYRVAKGDYLGEVADRYLDDFDRYREVARLNRLADPDRIHPGQLLKLPAGAVDEGARPHATGRLVVRPAAPARPAPRTPTAPPGSGTPQQAAPGVDGPGGPAPAMGAGAARAITDDGINRPLAVSAVLAVASIVGAQIGAVLGLRRRPALRTAGRTLVSGRHRKD
ncbi:LysM peptidoglycan-binding domain-containing protein [Micromonospora coerulea]|uniref:LysM peptidoglycan-binding domain-containing protein n=1 Tax=Micromonospora coerulea TaxID=47856 RepID=UPI001903237F|nr:LysM peptidoglycan-binding domain-containing protein [Micromonospora veneta]